MGRPKLNTDNLSKDELRKLENKRQSWARATSRYREEHPDWRKLHYEGIQRRRADEYADNLSESLGLSSDHAPEIFNPERISVEDYERCQCFLLRWMAENFNGVKLPDIVKSRLDALIKACDKHLYMDDTRGYMQIIMA